MSDSCAPAGVFHPVEALRRFGRLLRMANSSEKARK